MDTVGIPVLDSVRAYGNDVRLLSISRDVHVK